MNHGHKDLSGRLPRYYKYPAMIAGVILTLSIIGYVMILYGGNLIVDEEDLVLDARTTVETPDGDILKIIYAENRDPVDIKAVPEHVQDAFVSVEDRRFHEHAGVDFSSVIRAIYKDIIAFEKVEGASTITQQLAKNISLQNDKTWLRKTKDVMAAIYLERNFTKDEILELYMNQMYFGHGVYGVETASQFYFSKPVGELTVAEGAMLAGMAKAPNAYSPIDHPDAAMDRRDVVLQAMENSDSLSTEERLSAQGKTLGLNMQEKETNPALDSYIDLVTKEASEKHNLSFHELQRGGYRIIVNIDETLQDIAYEQFQDDDYFPGNTNNVEGAFVMMDQQTGEIVAAMGGRDYSFGDLNRTTVNRQPGSVLKPLAVYAPALMTDDFQPYTMIPDQETDYEGYTVSNADGNYADAVSIYKALEQSKNAPAVWLLNRIGVNDAKTYLEQMDMGIDDDGLAIALGGLEDGLSPLELAKGYRTFAHGGETIEPSTIARIDNGKGETIVHKEPSKQNVFRPQVAWDMTKMLLDVVDNGTGTAGDYENDLAGKTGTTEHPSVDGAVKDAWFLGYTPEYVTALWMGYDKTDEDHFLQGGSSYPTMLTKRILTEADEELTLAEKFSKPEHVKDLPDPIELTEVTEVEGRYTLGGLTLVKGKLEWKAGEDDRIIYRIYKEKQGIDERIGEVEGGTSFIIDDVSMFNSDAYYVVPYDPLTQIEGTPSRTVELSW